MAIRQKIKKYIFTETFLLHLEKNSGVRYMQGKFFNWTHKNEKGLNDSNQHSFFKQLFSNCDQQVPTATHRRFPVSKFRWTLIPSFYREK